MKSVSIATRLASIVSLALLLAMCVFWLVNGLHTRIVLQAQADRLGSTIARQTAELLAEHVQANDLISINVILEELAAGPAVVEAMLLDEQGERVASAGAASASASIRLLIPPALLKQHYVHGVEFLGASHGTVNIGLDLGYLEATLSDSLILVAAATVILMIAAWWFVLRYCQTSVTFPLKLLAHGLNKMRHGEIIEFPDTTGQGEFTNLTRQFNATARFLAHHTFLEKRGEDTPVAGNEARPSQAQTEPVSVLVIRMSNYPALVTAMGLPHALDQLEHYYLFAGAASRIYGGRVSHYHEEEILVSFEQASLAEEHAWNSILAGQLFLRLVGHLNAGSEGVRGNASFCLAAHSGEAPARLHSPVTGGTDCLIGETLDRARQICDGCPDNSLLIGSECHQLAGAESRVPAEPFDQEAGDASIVLALAPTEEIDELLDRQSARLIEMHPDRQGGAS